MKKTIEITEGSAIRVETIKFKGKPFASIRKMYKKKGDKKWLPAKQGLTIPFEQIADIAKLMKKAALEDPNSFTEVDNEQ